MSSCLSCVLYVSCRDPDKSHQHLCDRYEGRETVSSIAELLDMQMPGKKRKGRRRSTEVQEGLNMSDGEAHGQELQLVKMLDQAFASHNKVPPDIRIDDRDVPEFPNFFEFCMSKDGLDTPPFARQLAIGLHLFGEWCPNKRCSSPRFMDITNVPVDFPAADFPDKITMLKHGTCPKCGHTKRGWVRRNRLHSYAELAACVGQRAGKSSAVALFSAYLIHKYLKLQKPLEVFGLMRGSILTATFVALTFNRALRLLWAPLHNHLTGSPWFQAYHEVLDYYGQKYGEEVYKLKDQIVEYPHRSLVMYPSGPNKRTLRGDTRFLTAIDELGWFLNEGDSDSKERAGADEIYTALDRSLLTIRAKARRLLEQGYHNVPTAYAFNISSPSHPRDKIMTLVRDHANSSQVFTVHLPTWEMNPDLPQDSPDIQKVYQENPMKAERDYGANPPLNENPFIHNGQLLYRLASGTNRVQYQYMHKKDQAGRRMRAASVENVRTESKVRRSLLAIDAGFSNNSFALVIGHPRESLDGEVTYHLDTFVEVAPTKDLVVLNYSKLARDLIYPLIKELNVGIVVADRWNSLKLLHDVEEELGILAFQYSMKYPDFVYVRDYLEDEQPKVVLPRAEMPTKDILEIDQGTYPKCFRYKPVSHFYFQCLTVNDTGKTVTKGMNLTDDLFRAAALCLSQLFDEDLVKRHLLNKDRSRRRGVGVLGTPLRQPIGVAEGIGALSTNSGTLAQDPSRNNQGAIAQRRR